VRSLKASKATRRMRFVTIPHECAEYGVLRMSEVDGITATLLLATLFSAVRSSKSSRDNSKVYFVTVPEDRAEDGGLIITWP
jgi:hypothetical protein